MRRTAVALAIGASLAVAGCSSSGGGDRVEPTPPTTSVPRRPSSTLSFREVRDIVKCERKANGARDDALLPGGDCFTLGPVLIERSNLDAASVVYDQTMFEWAVNVHFADDEFSEQVAQPMIGRLVAIVVDGEVQSVPELRENAIGRDVPIVGNFSKQEAIQLAADLTGVDPSEVIVDSTGAPT